MRLLDALRFRVANLFKRSQMNAELEEELRGHIQLRADDLERYVRSLSDDEIDARIVELDQAFRVTLASHGVECADMDIHKVMACLADIEKVVAPTMRPRLSSS